MISVIKTYLYNDHLLSVERVMSSALLAHTVDIWSAKLVMLVEVVGCHLCH